MAVLCHQTVTAQHWCQGLSQYGRVLNKTRNDRNIVPFELTTPLVLKEQAIHYEPILAAAPGSACSKRPAHPRPAPSSCVAWRISRADVHWI
ncbi:VOC family protein [Sodalis sp.]|uniref:VOC family protein n=1 Tax=Sodalis sp. (in: enterobacteria) TaxID=1898979 RepID=UPI00387368C5